LILFPTPGKKIEVSFIPFLPYSAAYSLYFFNKNDS